MKTKFFFLLVLSIFLLVGCTLLKKSGEQTGSDQDTQAQDSVDEDDDMPPFPPDDEEIEGDPLPPFPE